MEPTIEILISSPLSGSEAAALRDIVAAVLRPALILANFEISRGGVSHQIDFVVIAEPRAELIELKNITAPLRGGVNGPWQIETSPGSFVPYSGPNPWEQARDAKLALSDAMHDYAKQYAAVPKPILRRYYEQFDASVTVYPMLVPGSHVPRGNYKAWIRSFPETVAALNGRPLPVRSSWGITDWKAFALKHLGLIPATLSQAIDAAVFAANQRIEEYAARLKQTDLAPLLLGQDDELVGQNVIKRLSGPADVVLFGRSGLGKSFHLEHYRQTCFSFDEIPVLLNARCYQRDLNKAIHKSIGQYTRLTPAELLEAAQRLGRRPVLIVDAWNDCSESMQTDLGDDLAAFQLRYDARLIAASQVMPRHRVFSGAARLALAPLRAEHKQTIFAFHAGRRNDSIPAHCYQPFATAFDLSIAGRCQINGAIAETRTDLYRSYVRSALPSMSARAVLRKLAWYMGENFKPALPINEYECTVEKLAQELGAPLPVGDELLKSRLLSVDREVVTFEHDLLRDYFRAEQLLRNTETEDLSAKLEEPKYTALYEFIIPALANARVTGQLLNACGVDLLNVAFHGWLGTVAKQIVCRECQRVLTECRDQLSNLNIEPSIGEPEDGRRFISAAHVVDSACASEMDKKYCAVLAQNLGDDAVREAFLELLEVGEWALKQACERAGHAHRMKPNAIWRELVHHNVMLSHYGPVHPLLFMCHQVQRNRALARDYPNRRSVIEALLRKLHTGNAGVLTLLLLMAALRYSDSIEVADLLAIARQAWDTGLPNLKMEALDFVHSNSEGIHRAGDTADKAVIALLETFDVNDNIFLSTEWLETRCCFSEFDSGIDVGSAAQEYRNILTAARAGDDPLYQLAREAEPSLTFNQFAAKFASSALGKIFEDVFQGAYYEAYQTLSNEERKNLLTLALEEQQLGFFTDWYLKELQKFGFEGAEHILCRLGSRIDPDSICPQDSVGCFIMAHEAWAGISAEPIPYQDTSSEEHRAWGIVGELIFWLNRRDTDSAGRVSFLCGELVHYSKALPDVLRQIAYSNKGMGAPPAFRLLLARCEDAIRKALHDTLERDGASTSVFRGFADDQLVRWTLSTLGDVGDRRSIMLLRALTDSVQYGRYAIEAIEQIERRLAEPSTAVIRGW